MGGLGYMVGYGVGVDEQGIPRLCSSFLQSSELVRFE
jgi:hypothetical protein